MTTKPTDSQKLELLYKKYLGYPDAYPGTLPSVEAPGSARQKVFSSLQILAQDVPSTAPSGLTVDNTFVGGSGIKYTNVDYPYIVKYVKLPLTSVKPNTSFTYSYTGLPNLLTNVIPTNFDGLGSYAIYVFLNNIQVSPNIWVLDVDAGYITFFDANVTQPVTITFWRYEGEVGLNNWVGEIIPATKGGTGVNNGTKTITLGGNLTTSGNHTTTLTTTGNTSVILPTSGTLISSTSTVDIRNLASTNWSVGVEQSLSNWLYATSYTVNGSNSENSIEYGIDPYDRPAILWACINNDLSLNQDGGWNIEFPASETKNYISIIYLKRVGALTSGEFRHGCSLTNTNNMNNSQNTDPYFINSYELSSLPQDVWCISIGLIYASDHSSTTSSLLGGIYRLDTGVRLTSNTSFKMRAGATTQMQRVYMFNSSDSGVVLQFWSPQFYEINGNELPSIQNIIPVSASRMPALTGDVTTTTGTVATTISNGSVSLSKMAQLQANTIIGNNTASSSTPLALSTDNVKSMLGLAITSGAIPFGNSTSTGLDVDSNNLYFNNSTDTLNVKNVIVSQMIVNAVQPSSFSTDYQIPEADMLSNTLTTVNNVTYTTSASSNSTGAYNAFSTLSGSWHAADPNYTNEISTGVFQYAGSEKTTVSGVEQKGAWLQIQSTMPFKINTFRYKTAFTGDRLDAKSLIVAGSDDGITWTTVSSQLALEAGLPAGTYSSVIVVNSTIFYSYYRIIILQAYVYGSGTNISMNDLDIKGLPQQSQMMRVDNSGCKLATYGGNVGIATTSPNAKLHVQHSSTGYSRMGLSIDMNVSSSQTYQIPPAAMTTNTYETAPTFVSTTFGLYTVTTSSNFGDGFPGWKAFNRLHASNDSWISIANFGSQVSGTIYRKSDLTSEWIKIECSNSQYLTGYRYRTRNEDVRGDPYVFTMSGSNDNLSYTVLHSFTGSGSQTKDAYYPSSTTTYPITSPAYYRFYRFDIYQVWQVGSTATSYYCSLGELELFTTPVVVSKLRARNDNVIDMFPYDNTGNVGIGTDNPLARLHVKYNNVTSYRYPPVAMTAADILSVNTSDSFLNGTYTVTSSTLGLGNRYALFDRTDTSEWRSAVNVYNTSTPFAYNQSATLGNVSGEWVKLQVPFPTKITSYNFKTANVTNRGSPSIWTMLGSTNNTTWTVIEADVSETPPAQNTNYLKRPLSVNAYYTYFAFVFKNVNSNVGYVNLGEIELYGVPQLAGLIVEGSPVPTGTQLTTFSNLSDASVYIRKLHTDTPNINTYGGSIFFGDNSGSDNLASGISGVQTTSDDDQYGLAFFCHTSANTNSTVQETMRIDHNGNVGIGTSTPKCPLQIGSTQMINIIPPSNPTSDVFYWYKLTEISYNTNTNNEFRINGILSSHTHSTGKAFVDVSFSVRGNSTTTDDPRVTGIINGIIGTLADIEIYRDTTTTLYTLYLKIGQYNLVNLNLQRIGGNALFLYDGTFVSTDPTTATNTLVYNLKDGIKSTIAFKGGILRNCDGNVGIGTSTPSSTLEVTRTAGSSTSPYFQIIQSADTAITASTEAPSVRFNLSSTRTWANGNITKQRFMLVNAPTIAFTNPTPASTVTDIATVAIDGAPKKGTNATLTNTHALLIEEGAVSTATASYGLTCNAQSGATNNYTAVFLGGNVGIGTTAPTSRLHVEGNTLLNGNVNVKNASLTSNSNDLFINASDGNDVTIRNTAGSATGQSVFNSSFVSLYSDALYINSNNNIGIGTTQPTANLHIATTNGPSNLIKCTSTHPTNGGTEDVSFNVKIDSSGNSILTMGDVFYNNTEANTTVQLHSAGNSFFNGGNLGIGTSTPVSVLNLKYVDNITSSYKYPPIGMTSSSQTVTGMDFYFNGTYTVTVSSNSTVTPSPPYNNYTGVEYGPFSTNADLLAWFCSVSYTTSTVGTYTGSNSITNVSGSQTTISGEWIKLKIPSTIVLTSYKLIGVFTVDGTGSPRTWAILGSNDGTNWDTLDNRLSSPAAPSAGVYNNNVPYTVTNTNAYTYFAFIVNTMNNGSNGKFGVSTLEFYGSPKSPAFLVENEATEPFQPFTIDYKGNVGIGIPAPLYTLHLSTDKAAKTASTTWTVTSDQRLKENILKADLDICYNNVKNITLHRFRYRDDLFNHNQIHDRSRLGWIAQEVEFLFPKAVTKQSQYGYDDCRSLDVDQLYASMYGCVQKLIEYNESNINRITDLENRYNLLKSENDEKNVKIIELENKIVNIEMQYELLLNKLKVVIPDF